MVNCPVGTPEGPNVGLIASLASFARVNEHGFIETPYRVVKDGVVTNDIRYFMALDEKNKVVVEAATPLNEESRFTTDL